jgi:1,2-phenylacetyl-CoA epoxidase catalytic subunit
MGLRSKTNAELRSAWIEAASTTLKNLGLDRPEI